MNDPGIELQVSHRLMELEVPRTPETCYLVSLWLTHGGVLRVVDVEPGEKRIDWLRRGFGSGPEIPELP